MRPVFCLPPSLSLRVVDAQAVRAAEDGKIAAGVLMHPDPSFDVVMTMPVFWDLQDQTLLAPGVVLAAGAVLLNAENVFRVAGERHEGPSRLLYHDGKALVMGGQESLGQKTVGRHHGGNTAKPQFLGQPILQGSQHALEAPPGLRVRRTQLQLRVKPCSETSFSQK